MSRSRHMTRRQARKSPLAQRRRYLSPLGISTELGSIGSIRGTQPAIFSMIAVAQREVGGGAH